MLRLITVLPLMCVMLCHATLVYNVLCLYTKHADLFERDTLGEKLFFFCLTVLQEVEKGCNEAHIA